MTKVFFSIAGLVVMSLVFTFKNKKSEFDSRTCEYSFYVKCDGSNQFVEVIRAKDQSTAKAMCVNRYSKCKVTTKNANGQNCD